MKEHRQGPSAIQSHMDERSMSRNNYSCDLFSILDCRVNDFDIMVLVLSSVSLVNFMFVSYNGHVWLGTAAISVYSFI